MKKYLVSGALAIALGVVLFAGCAKPPTTEQAALKDQLTQLETQGAQVFATQQYDMVTAGMNELQSLMDNKKNKNAKAKADSLKTEMDALKAAVETQAPAIAKQGVDGATAEVAKFKALMTPEAKKVLGAEETKKLDEMGAGFDKDAAALATDLGNSAFMNAFNNSKTLKDKVTMASQEVTQKMEEAKAKKGAKGAKAAPAKAAPKKASTKKAAPKK